MNVEVQFGERTKNTQKFHSKKSKRMKINFSLVGEEFKAKKNEMQLWVRS